MLPKKLALKSHHGEIMEEVLLGIDVVLEAIIGNANGLSNKLIEQARKGQIQINILHSALYCAFYSVDSDDTADFRQIAELLKYAQIIPDAETYLGPQDRELWTPSKEEVDNWRKCAFAKKEA